jgi:hypothetical protein
MYNEKDFIQFQTPASNDIIVLQKAAEVPASTGELFTSVSG